jgi:hypothetical protein
MSVGVMKDYKLKISNTRFEHRRKSRAAVVEESTFGLR